VSPTRVFVGLVAVVIALNIGLRALEGAFGGRPAGPASSAYGTVPEGAAAYAELLRQAGHRVRWPVAHGRPDDQELGEPGHRYPVAPREVFDELRAASAGGRADYSGITYDRLDAGEALYWPCPDSPAGGPSGAPGRDGRARPAHPGTPRMFLDRFAHPDGRARFAEVDHRGPAETTTADRPLYATTGRVLAQYQSGAQTRRVPELNEAAGEVFVEVHPDTAERFGLREGEPALVSSARGGTVARVRLDGTLRTDTVFLPFHFPGRGRANLLTNPALDPHSRMPEFKVCAVRIEPWAGPV